MLAVTAFATGCATRTQQDPLESVNRKIFSFNEGVDRVAFKPVATVYQHAVPTVVRTGVSNFFSNLQDPWTSVNLALQGRFGEGASTLARFGTNTTVGMLGAFDVATGWGMPEKSEDFGLTLDAWGVGTGPYLVMPVFGASNLRDTLASPVNSVGNMKSQVGSVAVRNSMTVLQAVNQRAAHLRSVQLLDQALLDKYQVVRDMHLKRRGRSDHAEAASL